MHTWPDTMNVIDDARESATGKRTRFALHVLLEPVSCQLFVSSMMSLVFIYRQSGGARMVSNYKNAFLPIIRISLEVISKSQGRSR